MKEVKKRTSIYFILMLLVVCFVACNSSIDTPISEQKLTDILLDIHTAEALTESESQAMRDSMSKIYYSQIFEHHGVTRRDFDSTMAIYARYPERFDSIYSRIGQLISLKKDSLHKS